MKREASLGLKQTTLSEMQINVSLAWCKSFNISKDEFYMKQIMPEVSPATPLVSWRFLPICISHLFSFLFLFFLSCFLSSFSLSEAICRRNKFSSFSLFPDLLFRETEMLHSCNKYNKTIVCGFAWTQRNW